MKPTSRNLAFFGGTFDPIHCGHLYIATKITDLFTLDLFYFLPAFHAPHKPDSVPTSAYHRFAMLCLATADEPKIAVSTLEIDHRKSRYSFDTLHELKARFPADRIFFVMGADSWKDIRTWHRWEEVLLLTDHIIVSRPGYEIDLTHVTDKVRDRIIDVRGTDRAVSLGQRTGIFITDAVQIDISATDIRRDVGQDEVLDRPGDVPPEVAKYIEKYELYR